MATKQVNGVKVQLSPEEAAEHEAQSAYNADPQREEEAKDREALALSNLKAALIALATVTYTASPDIQAVYPTKKAYLKAVRDEYRAQL